jgi:hypothetical protein
VTVAAATDFVHEGRTNGTGVASPGAPATAGCVVDGAFEKVRPDAHPLPLACEIAVYLQDYHRSSSKLARFGKIVGIDEESREYLVMLDNFECVATPMRRAEWRKVGT